MDSVNYMYIIITTCTYRYSSNNQRKKIINLGGGHERNWRGKKGVV